VAIQGGMLGAGSAGVLRLRNEETRDRGQDNASVEQ
jgi:hypothetical protein